ncbi:hypothetical protein [Aquimarina sp. Aq78]|uniref:hypothetical protein n=1 Tax=Aquimarina sp. Aq78 TaxID=1191889 RepID=UPI00131CB72A|nr:hypothetical protein [Aquimarina sp. Aq78]
MLQNISNLKGVQVLKKENDLSTIRGGDDGRTYFVLKGKDGKDYFVLKGKDGKDYFAL